MIKHLFTDNLTKLNQSFLPAADEVKKALKNKVALDPRSKGLLALDMRPYNVSRPDELEAMLTTMGFIVGPLENLETFVIHYPLFLKFPFVDDKLRPLQFNQFLVRLDFSSMSRFEDGVSATNAIWMLCFCVSLRQALLIIRISKDGAKFLSDYDENLKGKSKVKDLAIKTHFVSDPNDPKTWWGGSSQIGGKWKCGNKKSAAVFQFLQCTSSLNSCEVWLNRDDETEQNQGRVFHNSLIGLESSYSTIKHLRFFEAD